MKDTLYEIAYESLKYILGLIKLFKKFYMTLESKYFFFVISACYAGVCQRKTYIKMTNDYQRYPGSAELNKHKIL